MQPSVYKRAVPVSHHHINLSLFSPQAITTLVDIVGTMALLAKDHKRGGVSIDLNVNFLKAARTGELVKVRGRVLKLGKSLGFTQVDVLSADGVTLLATGRHTKAM